MASSAQRQSQQLSAALERVTSDLRRIEKLLVSGDDFEAGVLNDFRDAVNRVRTTAWGVQQFAQSKTAETDPNVVLSVLAGERIRVAFVMCQNILADLNNPAIRWQKGPLARLSDVSEQLAKRLNEVASAKPKSTASRKIITGRKSR